MDIFRESTDDEEARGKMEKGEVKGTANKLFRADSGFSEYPVKEHVLVEMGFSSDKGIKPLKHLETLTKKRKRIALICGFCKREFKNRSEMYRHYSIVHYRKMILQKVGNPENKCPICEVRYQNSLCLLNHYGRAHNMVEQFLPEKYHVPALHCYFG